MAQKMLKAIKLKWWTTAQVDRLFLYLAWSCANLFSPREREGDWTGSLLVTTTSFLAKFWGVLLGVVPSRFPCWEEILFPQIHHSLSPGWNLWFSVWTNNQNSWFSACPNGGHWTIFQRIVCTAAEFGIVYFGLFSGVVVDEPTSYRMDSVVTFHAQIDIERFVQDEEGKNLIWYQNGVEIARHDECVPMFTFCFPFQQEPTTNSNFPTQTWTKHLFLPKFGWHGETKTPSTPTSDSQTLYFWERNSETTTKENTVETDHACSLYIWQQCCKQYLVWFLISFPFSNETGVSPGHENKIHKFVASANYSYRWGLHIHRGSNEGST